MFLPRAHTVAITTNTLILVSSFVDFGYVGVAQSHLSVVMLILSNSEQSLLLSNTSSDHGGSRHPVIVPFLWFWTILCAKVTLLLDGV